MGAEPSKEEDHVLENDVDRLKSCMYNHKSNVHSIDSAVKAQDNSVQHLEETLKGLQNGQERTSVSMDITRTLLSNIQTTLTHQVSAVSESFSIFENCLQEISDRYSKKTEPTQEYPDMKTADSHMAGPSKDNIGYDRLSNSDAFSKKGAQSSSKDTLTNIRKENKAISANNSKSQEQLAQSDEIKKIKRKMGREINELKSKADCEINQLKRKINRMQYFVGQANRISIEKEDIESKYVQLQNVNKRLTEEKQRYEYNERVLDSKLQRLEHEKGNLEFEVGNLRRQMNAIEEEKRKIKERKMIVPVQLFYQRKGDLMKLVINELSSILHTQMHTRGLQLDIVRCDNISNIQPDKPILVLCINSSWLETDATTAIDGIHKSERTALLIFHHKNNHALPNQPSVRRLTSSEFKQLGGIVDLAFLTGKGLYPCDMNNIAVSCIESFIQRNCPGQQ